MGVWERRSRFSKVIAVSRWLAAVSGPGGRNPALLTLLTICMLFGSGCNSEVKVTDDDLVVITAADLDGLILANTKTTNRKKQACIIDSRTADRYAAGHIAGSINLTSRAVRADDPRLSDYKVLVVYGQGWMDSSALIVSKRLLALRYDNVKTYRGGTDDWVETGHVLIPSSGSSAFDEGGGNGP